MLLRRLHPNARSLTAAAVALLVVASTMLAQRVWFSADDVPRAVVAVRAVATLPTVTTVAVTTTVTQRATVPRASRVARPVARVQAASSGSCDRPSTCLALRNCENGGSYARGGSWPRYFGAYQFSRGTWLSNGGTEANWGNADAPTQDANADLLYRRRGRQPWPLCGRHLR